MSRYSELRGDFDEVLRALGNKQYIQGPDDLPGRVLLRAVKDAGCRDMTTDSDKGTTVAEKLCKAKAAERWLVGSESEAWFWMFGLRERDDIGELLVQIARRERRRRYPV